MYPRCQASGKIAMKKRLLCVLILALGLNGFAVSGPLDKDLTLSLETRQVEELTPESCKFVVYINIENTSSKTYYLTRYRYRFIAEEKEYLQLNRVLPDGLEVSPGQKTMIAIPVKITYEHLFQAIEKTKNMEKVSCYLMGELYFTEGNKVRGSLPIAYAGEFPIFRTPRLEILELKANSVSLGGADLDYSFKFVNGNGFDLLVDDITYNLKLDGVLLSSGRIEGDKDISGKGEKVFFLHLLINYFDVGKDAHAALQKEDSLLLFEGSIKFRTAWGRLELPFVLNERIAISKRAEEVQ